MIRWVLFSALMCCACYAQAQSPDDQQDNDVRHDPELAPWDVVIRGRDGEAAIPIVQPLFNFLGGLAYQDPNEGVDLMTGLFGTDQASAATLVAAARDALDKYKEAGTALEEDFCSRPYPDARTFAGAMTTLDARYAAAKANVIGDLQSKTEADLWSDIVQFAANARSSTTTRTTDYYVWIEHNDYTDWLSKKCG